MPTFPEHLWRRDIGHFGKPDWKAISRHIESSVPQSDIPAAWEIIAREWALRLRAALGPAYTIHESPHFILLTDSGKDAADNLLHFLDRAIDTSHFIFPRLADLPALGKIPVITFETPETFDLYLSDYATPGSDFSVGEVFHLRDADGYGHFALLGADPRGHSWSLAYEIAHLIASHHAIPAWLHNAIADILIDEILGQRTYHVDHDIIRRHKAHWTPENIRTFWTGDSFSSPGEGHELSKHLSRFLLEALTQGDSHDIEALTLAATPGDAAFSAARQLFETTPAEILENLLGPGDWNPSPLGTPASQQ